MSTYTLRIELVALCLKLSHFTWVGERRRGRAIKQLAGRLFFVVPNKTKTNLNSDLNLSPLQLRTSM